MDSYTRRARLLPVLFVALPAGVAALAWVPEAPNWWSALASVVIGSGVPAFLAQVGRDWGKRKEPGLWRSWGGPPTTRALRHRGNANAVLLKRRHQRLEALMPGISLPTAEQEEAAPIEADQTLEACTAFLREKTRDAKRFPLVFQENCNYGFRRNLWGMKPLGLIICGVALVTVLVLLAAQLRRGDDVLLAALGSLINSLALLAWIFVVTPDWVRVAADAYAERLLETVDSL